MNALFAYAEGEQKRLILSVVLSVLSVAAGLVPFYCMYEVICLFTAGTATAAAIVKWCVIAIAVYAGKILLFSLSSGTSHAMAYTILEGLRLRLADRFLHAPLGSVEDHSIGEIKSMMVDKIENLEPPLAHMIPEGAGHIVLPIVSIIALLCIDWRLALANGGVNVKDMPLSQLSEYVSLVTQDNFLFRCSLLENIRLGNPSATDEEVKAAARAAQCEEFIAKLPQGYDTPAGEAGKRLSGGEKQRIAIARMLLKNAPIVILDEATAFTDPENEDKIQRSIAALTKGKTLLVIAHRLSTIQNADNIVVLRNGAIEAQGKQAELLETCPLYREMWLAHIGAKDWAVSAAEKEA